MRFPMALPLAVLLCGAALAQSKNPEDLAPGKLLVVPQQSPDPLFTQSVILLVRYDRTGALGLRINLRTTVPASRILTDVKGADKLKDPVYAGGPVQLAQIMALDAPASPVSGASAGTSRVLQNLYLVTSKHDLEAAFKDGKAQLRIYAGYCGWGPGQLDNEVRRGGWFLFDAKAEQVFDAKPETLWDRMIARTDLKVAFSRPPLYPPR